VTHLKLEDAEAPQRSALEELATDDSSRKKFLKMAGGGSAAAGLSLLIAACGGSSKKSSSSSSQPTTPPSTSTSSSSGGSTGDIAIANYALTLEYLEADFYKKVVASGLFKGNKYASTIAKFGEQEATHVSTLEAAIKKFGGTPATQPKAKFPLKSASSVLQLAATVENLGAAAYLGQAAKIKSKEVLALALSIHTVEARHASVLNTLLGKSVTPTGAFAKPADMQTVLAAVKPFIVG
jgi:rubrerythrin